MGRQVVGGRWGGKRKQGGNVGKRKGMITSSILALLIFSLVNIGWGAEHGIWGSSLREGRDHVGVERLLALLDTNRVRIYLGLTDPQVERLRQIVVETEKANVKTRAEIEVRSIELREALRADKPDRDGILKQVQEISDLRGEMMKHDAEAILAAKAVLSLEQQRKIFVIFENRHEGGPVGEEPGALRAKPLPRPGVPAQVPLHPGEPPVQ
jgi:hypothetical protein